MFVLNLLHLLHWTIYSQHFIEHLRRCGSLPPTGTKMLILEFMSNEWETITVTAETANSLPSYDRIHMQENSSILMATLRIYVVLTVVPLLHIEARSYQHFIRYWGRVESVCSIWLIWAGMGSYQLLVDNEITLFPWLVSHSSSKGLLPPSWWSKSRYTASRIGAYFASVPTPERNYLFVMHQWGGNVIKSVQGKS